MKSTSNSRDSHIGRGQLILVTGLIIALMMVALVVLLNTAIFTENLASRGQDQSGREAIEYRNVVADGIREVVIEENEIRQNETAILQGYAPSRDELNQDVRTGIETLDNYTARQYALKETVAGIDNVTLDNGSGIHQPENRSMVSSSPSNDVNWTLANDVRGTRDHSMIVRGNLTQTTDPAAEAFRVTVDDGTNEWSLYVYEDGAGDHQISVKNASDGAPNLVNCPKPANLPMEIDVTEGAINGTSCSAIQFGKGVSKPYTISYTWGNRSAGSYRLTVNSTNIGSGVNSIGSADSPFQTPVIYSAEFTVNFQTESLEYRGQVNVTPG